MGNYHLFVIFAVLDVSLAVNLCINCSFFTFLNLKPGSGSNYKARSITKANNNTSFTRGNSLKLLNILFVMTYENILFLLAL